MHEGREADPLASEFAGDPEMTQLIELFVSEMPRRIEALEQSWRTNQLEETRRLAHQLKGASGGYGFGTIGQAAARLEESLTTHNTDLEAIRDELDRLIDLCHRTAA